MNSESSTKIDKGFTLSYWKLSYRRKFIRTLWMGVLGLGLCLVLLPNDYSFLNLSKNGLIFLGLLIGVSQTVYTYNKWKKNENTNDE